MPVPPLPPLDLRLERAASRARKLLGAGPGGQGSAGPESARQTEGTGPRRGPPDAVDARAIARRLRDARPASAAGESAHDPAATALAETLVERAREALAKLLGGAADGSLGAHDSLALEAVIQVQGRPALRIEAEGLEGLDPSKHPDSDIWRPVLDDHAATLFAVGGATGAVRVLDLAIAPHGAPWC